MGRRRGKRKRRGGGTDGPATAQAERQALVPWRQRVGSVLDTLAAWARQHYAAALDAHLARCFGDPPAPERPEDAERAIEDACCAPGSADGQVSILRAFSEQAPGLAPEERDQVRRWETERRRGVFVVQASLRDRLVLWDPLEGAPLTLHLLEKQSPDEARRIGPGTVTTAVFQPWMARLVAIGRPEYFADRRALALFREQTTSSGATWHEPPPAAPQPRRSGDGH
jgi:hypothetical protein